MVGSVTFQPGQTSQIAPFTWACDSADNDDRVVAVTLSNPSSPLTVSAGNGTATLTVQDDDAVRLWGLEGAAVLLCMRGCVQALNKLHLASPFPLICLPSHAAHLSQLPTVTMTASAPAVEGNSGATPAIFTVQLSAASVSERRGRGTCEPRVLNCRVSCTSTSS
jgi:hypothetical protein